MFLIDLLQIDSEICVHWFHPQHNHTVKHINLQAKVPVINLMEEEE